MALFENEEVQSRIDEAVKVIDKMTAGDFTSHIETSGSDVFVPLMRALKNNQVTLERHSSESRRDKDTIAELQVLLDTTAQYFERIAKGDIPPKITDEYKGEYDTLKNNMNATIDMLSEARRVSDENLRVKVALDNVTTNVMIADNERNIIYMNASIGEMMAHAEDDVRKVFPNFTASRLLGSNMDQFHKNPAHQGSLLANFTNTHHAQIQVGARTFSLTANPIINKQGERLGSVVEWADLTAEVAAEKDVSALIEAASAGELSKRISLEDKTGFTHDIAANINNLLDAITTPLNVVADYLRRIAEGDLPAMITDEYKGEYDALKNNMNATIGMLSKARRVSDENQRVKVALDNVTTNVMISDNERNIIYMNASIGEMMAHAEDDIRKVFPHFNASRLLGSNMDQFHRDPSHQRSLLASFTDTHRAQIRVGARTFSLTANPIINEKGERLGAVVEWADRTEEVAAEKDVSALIEAASAGELSERISLEGKSGFTHDIAASINNLLDAITTPLGVVADYLKRIAMGDMPPKITDEYKGEYDALKNNMNATIGILNGFIDSIHYVTAEHDKGDIDQMIDTDRFEGAYKIMAQGVNNMVNGHIADKKKAMACIMEFGKGNFNAPLEKFPGKKAFINETIEQVRANLKALIADTSMLSKAALEGRIQIRADAGKHQGDFRSIVEGINATLESIVNPIITVNAAIDSINTAASEIAAGNADLSHRTEQQAANLEETAASMEELASTVKQNADNARQAQQMAVSASDVAVKGGGMVQQVITTMSAINESAHKIVDIISVIDGIALQTNILALNAAVEAARAGEQGRGFAVVASEVRNLAQRSAEAAKEIKSLIGDSVEKVEDGSKLVSEAGKTMDEIVSSVKSVTDIMSQIAAASMEQSSGIDQVNQAVTQMDEATQQNAALVEEAAAAAHSLEDQASILAETMSQFRIDTVSRRSAAPKSRFTGRRA